MRSLFFLTTEIFAFFSLSQSVRAMQKERARCVKIRKQRAEEEEEEKNESLSRTRFLVFQKKQISAYLLKKLPLALLFRFLLECHLVVAVGQLRHGASFCLPFVDFFVLGGNEVRGKIIAEAARLEKKKKLFTCSSSAKPSSCGSAP